MLEGCTPYPEERAKAYRENGCWRGQTLSALPEQWARAFGDRAALIEVNGRTSYAELAVRVDRMAAGFLARGLRAGDRVIVQLPNTAEFVVVFFALLRIDAKPVFSLVAHRANEIRHLCAASGAVAHIVAGDQPGLDHIALARDVIGECPTLRMVFVSRGETSADQTGAAAPVTFVPLSDVDAEPTALPVPDSGDVAFFLLSGGTTALPKLIPRTHDDYLYQISRTAELLGISSDDRYLATLPLEFNFTWGCPGVLGTLSVGGGVVLAADPDPYECFEAIEREQVTFTSVVPAVAQLWLEALAEAPFDVSSLRVLQIGGAPLARNVAERVRAEFGCVLQQVFGMAEGMISFTLPSDSTETILSTQGRPISPFDEVRIVDESGAVLVPEQTGELLVRGPYTLCGYYRAPEHNARAFTADGFYRTGDLARLTGAGELIIEGRIKDVIIRAGQKISAAELEGHLLALPSVDRVAVVGQADPDLGEAICAYIMPAGSPPLLREMRDALRGRGIAEFKLPDRLEIIDDLPLTGLGKVDKSALVRLSTHDVVSETR
ncbi:AMP-binding protein [Nocardia sp. NPDC051030]|uniref:(2,3-dihydroxybenzoyl)adenylate synthase n=1 Tax=Nocardia sp. NPDC051030 TaxID=3155162 RepID=UPI0034384545